MKTIPLTRGRVAIVDDEDFDALNMFKWHIIKDSCNLYAVRHDAEKHARLIMMHRAVMATPVGYQTDHRNGDGLDNRKDNLRVCSCSQNQHNSRLRRDNSSGYKGVGWHKHLKKWGARIGVNGKSHHLGYFESPQLAAEAYNARALAVFGEFARGNDL